MRMGSADSAVVEMSDGNKASAPYLAQSARQLDKSGQAQLKAFSKIMNNNVPNDDDVILVDNVELRLPSPAGEVNILRGVDLKVKSGETVGVIGPSGSGKSTLMMTIAGLERPTSGRIVVLGENITGQSEDALASFRRRNVGIVFQAFHLIPSMTALENVALPLDLTNDRSAIAKAEHMLELVGLKERLTHYPSQLSGGEQQRVAIARAFVAEPRILLADEPTGNLDQKTGRMVVELLFSLQKKLGSTMMLITHDPSLAALCARTISIEDGRIVSQGGAQP